MSATGARGPGLWRVAAWIDEAGNTYVWPQHTADNRRSRVVARMARYELDTPRALATLRLYRSARVAAAYVDGLAAGSVEVGR